MRKLFLTAFVLAASLVVASTGLALEKTAMLVTDDGPDGWSAGSQTCNVQYYNTCTGWLWVWGGWSAGDAMGTAFTGCGSNCTLDSGNVYFRTPAPAGYGFTGTAHVYAADANECPTGAPLASQALLPATGFNLLNWNSLSVPNTFCVVWEWGPGGSGTTRAGTDHPAAGPTGPASCGACFPTTRTNHTYYWGTLASPLCPGSALFDGVCDAQFMWDANMLCSVSVEDQSWGAVKNLYR